MSDLIKRSDAIKAVTYSHLNNLNREERIAHIMDIPSVDRPRGKVNAVKIYEQASHDLEFGYITLGEFEERTEPLKHLYYDRPRGEWIEDYNGNGWNDYWDYTCSNCGKKYERADAVLYKANYCPNCGAQMKGADDE